MEDVVDLLDIRILHIVIRNRNKGFIKQMVSGYMTR